MKGLTTEKTMTVKEVAEAMGVSEFVIKQCIKRIMPNKMSKGKTTYLNESEVAFISKELKSNNTVKDRLPVESVNKLESTTTKLEQDMLIMQAMQILVERSAELENKNKLLEESVTEKTNTINILTHTTKVYSATEIAKEIGFRSATALNNDLSQKGIQFKQNGTWVLYSNYANLGYTEIKQTVLDNGTVVYNRMFTGSGRKWLLKLYDVQ